MTIEGESVASWLLAEIGEDKSFTDKYQVEGELGFGAAGVVIGARHRVLEQRVAIKFLLSGQENPEAVARFLREARAASRIRNQHVVRVIDASTLSSGIPYLVMEHLDGVDLERMLHQSPHRQLPITDAIELILQTGEALAECHCVGIVHRDLKPSNLFCVYGADGLPMIKVLDFGIAKLGTTTIQGDLPEGAIGGPPPRRVFGSPAYMSPEQFESSTDVDLRSDIWAIGVILYEFVTGALPFQETSIYRIRKRVAEDTPRPLRELRRDSPADLWPVILKCIAKDPKQRYANLAELAKALIPFASPRALHSVARIVRTIEAPGSDTGALSLSSRPSSRSSFSPTVRAVAVSRPRTALLTAALLIAAVSVGWIWTNARPAPQTPSLAMRLAPSADSIASVQNVSAPPLETVASTSILLAKPSSSTPSNESAAPSPNTGSTTRRSAPDEHPTQPAASSAPTAAASVTASPSAEPLPATIASVAGPSSPTIDAGASAESPAPTAPADTLKWPVPIVEQRKRSH